MRDFLQLALPFVGIIALFFSCRSGKNSPDSYEKKQLIFGSGGGFMGTNEQFVLLDNGRLYTQDVMKDEYEEIGRVPKKMCKTLFQRADTLEIESTRFMNPGNKYFYLEVKNPSNQNRVTWGDSNTPIDEEYRHFYRKLMDLIRDKK
ncbi:MAG: hypothetical protein AAF694_02440 [Bacteroidota bacterium]